nr:hypothetical protein CFP56_49152 [Quercus suber]
MSLVEIGESEERGKELIFLFITERLENETKDKGARFTQSFTAFGDPSLKGRAVHKSVQVEFVPNPELTRRNWVRKKCTRWNNRVGRFKPSMSGGRVSRSPRSELMDSRKLLLESGNLSIGSGFRGGKPKPTRQNWFLVAKTLRRPAEAVELAEFRSDSVGSSSESSNRINLDSPNQSR